MGSLEYAEKILGLMFLVNLLSFPTGVLIGWVRNQKCLIFKQWNNEKYFYPQASSGTKFLDMQSFSIGGCLAIS